MADAKAYGADAKVKGKDLATRRARARSAKA